MGRGRLHIANLLVPDWALPIPCLGPPSRRHVGLTSPARKESSANSPRSASRTGRTSVRLPPLAVRSGVACGAAETARQSTKRSAAAPGRGEGRALLGRAVALCTEPRVASLGPIGLPSLSRAHSGSTPVYGNYPSRLCLYTPTRASRTPPGHRWRLCRHRSRPRRTRAVSGSPMRVYLQPPAPRCRPPKGTLNESRGYRARRVRPRPPWSLRLRRQGTGQARPLRSLRTGRISASDPARRPPVRIRRCSLHVCAPAPGWKLSWQQVRLPCSR